MKDKFTKTKIVLFAVNICFVVVCWYVLNIGKVPIREAVLKSKVSGVIRVKYRDVKNHAQPKILIDNLPYEYDIYNEKVFEMIDSNDYFIKDSGSFVYRLVKGVDTITFYQIVDGEELKK